MSFFDYVKTIHRVRHEVIEQMSETEIKQTVTSSHCKEKLLCVALKVFKEMKIRIAQDM